MTSITVGDIERAIALRFPPERAAAWDRVGLLAGDPRREVAGVALALDPTLDAIEGAVRVGANVLVTHHPAFLEPPAELRPGRGPTGVLFSALDSGVALINAHTNLDRDQEAQLLMPRALGLTPLAPLESSTMPMVLVTAYVPEQAAGAVKRAMEDAGAGRIGDYSGCSFAAGGVGSFTPAEGSRPRVGSPGVAADVDEVRLEMLAPPKRAGAVVTAAVSAHPYEEPLVSVTDVRIARNTARLGMVCATDEPTPLDQFAQMASAVYGVRARVWGDPSTEVRSVATSTGSAGSLVGDALAAGVQVLVAGEVRYHDALEAKDAGLGVIELGHDVTEWPLVGLLDSAVRSVPGIDPELVHLLPAGAGWWTT